jgi:hypothetical protein
MTGEQDSGDLVDALERIVERGGSDQLAGEGDVRGRWHQRGGDLVSQVHDGRAEMLLGVALDPRDDFEKVLGRPSAWDSRVTPMAWLISVGLAALVSCRAAAVCSGITRRSPISPRPEDFPERDAWPEPAAAIPEHGGKGRGVLHIGGSGGMTHRSALATGEAGFGAGEVSGRPCYCHNPIRRRADSRVPSVGCRPRIVRLMFGSWAGPGFSGSTQS